jgi:N-acetylated-alpha-linked acidic dipeptidase
MVIINAFGNDNNENKRSIIFCILRLQIPQPPNMKNISFLLLLAAILCISAGNPANDYTGFKKSNATIQRKWESTYDSILKPAGIDGFIKFLSAHPHHVGSVYDHKNAEFILSNFKQWGYQARIDTFYALFATPKLRVLETIGKPQFKAALKESPLKEDATSGQTTEQLPSYNAYSADGDVTAELVYVNRGVPADYEELDRLGVSVKGKIVIAKYGGSWRGIKPRLAQEHGAIGCIIYSDPKDDGYYQGEVYPKGPFKNETGVQRGSVMDIPLYPGDPLTPGYGDTKDAKRIERKDAPNLLKIPVLPISYEDAEPFLRGLGGQVVPENWRGGLPLTYHTGPGPVIAHLKLEFNWDVVPLYDVIAVMKGSRNPDQWVIRGNHYDAWVNGAYDPISGQATLLAEAQAVGQLVKQGMQLNRTIVYCAWDGEEEGLLGSTEWVEANAAELQQKAVIYINSDENGRGFLGIGGSHVLQKLANEVASDVNDPETNVSILERKKAAEVMGASFKEQKELMDQHGIKIDALGSGSDFSPFLQHIGIATLDLGFGGEDNGGEYHSIYDSYDMFNRFKDPGNKYGVVMAKTAGRLTLRMANADVIPFKFNDLYSTINDYATGIMHDLDDTRSKTEFDNRLIKQKYYTLAADPTKTNNPPLPKDEVPYLDFSTLQNALAVLKNSSHQYEMLANSAPQKPDSILNKLNTLLAHSEQQLLSAQGLPIRPWYKHAIYAPGYYTGYGVKTLPGLREAIENRDWKLAQIQEVIIANVITGYAAAIDEAVKILKGG